MVGLGACRGQQHCARGLGAGDECLAVIERLRGELSRMIDAHECRAGAAIGLRQRLGPELRSGKGSGGPGRREHRAQRAVEGGYG